jgi:hypothetical protein
MKIFKSGGILHSLKNYYLRKRYGGGCCDIFGLYYYLGKKILPPLKEFRKHLNGYPFAYINDETKENMTMEKWEEILDKMIYAFEAIELDEKCEKIDEKKQQEGFELFGKWYRSLWL